MIRNLRRIIIRQYPRAFFNPLKGPVLPNPIYIVGACVSSSCINCRRYKYGIPEEKSSSRAGQSLFETVDDKDENNLVTWEKTGDEDNNNNLEEYISDDSDDEKSDSELILQNLNINFVTLPRGSSAARKEVAQCLLETSLGSKKILVKKIGNIKALINKGLKPEKIFFSILNDLLRLNESLNGIELYKIHPVDAPLEMQRRKRAPCFAIFEVDNLKNSSSKQSSIPLTIICDKMHKSKNVSKIITAALSCGCEEIIMTPDCNVSTQGFNSNILGTSKDIIPIKYNQSWDVIRTTFPVNTNVFVAKVGKQDERLLTGKSNIPTVDFNNFDAWSTDRIGLICAEYLSNDALKFCHERNGQEIIIPGAVYEFSKSIMLVGAIAVELRKQWEMRERTKKTKVRN